LSQINKKVSYPLPPSGGGLGWGVTMRVAQHLKNKLQTQKQRHLFRTRRARQSKAAATVSYPEAQYLNFQSNNYLGLANHPDVITACQQAAAQYGVGSTSASIVGGYTTLHQTLEHEIAAFTNKPRALVFATGYLANISVLTTLASRRDTLYEDRNNHASLIAGARMAGCDLQRYEHNNMMALNDLINKNQTGAGIISDAVFSTHGDIAKVSDLMKIAKQHNLWLMLDDAHGIGVLGKHGRGTLEHLNIDANDTTIITGTFGKAFGTSGAFVAANDDVIESLIQFAKPYIYNTAMPPPMVAATLKSLELIQTEAWRREKLNELIIYFKMQAKEMGVELIDSTTAIQSIVIGDADKAIEIHDALQQKNILVSLFRPPTVPVNSSCLRISLTAEHNIGQIDQLVEALRNATPHPNPPPEGGRGQEVAMEKTL